MQGGDLDNRLPPRWLFVFEGVIGEIEPENLWRFKMSMRLGRFKRAAAQWEVHPHVRKVLWDLMWRRDYRFDIVTFFGEDFARALEKQLDRESLPFSNLWAVTEDSLAKKLATMPDVQYVIHADPSHHLSYGNRGLLVTDPQKLSLF